MTNATQRTECKGCLAPISTGRFCERCETKPVHEGYTRAQLSDAFDAVKDASNWKNPINAVLPWCSKKYQDTISAAVVFYAGCVPSFQREGRCVRVTALGYYVAVGA